MVLDFLIGLFVVAIMALAALSIAAIVEVALEYFETDQVLVVDPKTTDELERVAKKHGSRAHKRFVYDRGSKKAVLVESDRIAKEMRDDEVITVDIR